MQALERVLGGVSALRVCLRWFYRVVQSQGFGVVRLTRGVQLSYQGSPKLVRDEIEYGAALVASLVVQRYSSLFCLELTVKRLRSFAIFGATNGSLKFCFVVSYEPPLFWCFFCIACSRRNANLRRDSTGIDELLYAKRSLKGLVQWSLFFASGCPRVLTGLGLSCRHLGSFCPMCRVLSVRKMFPVCTDTIAETIGIRVIRQI